MCQHLVGSLVCLSPSPHAKSVAAHLQCCSLKNYWPPREALHIRKSLPSLSKDAALSERKIALGITENIEKRDSVTRSFLARFLFAPFCNLICSTTPTIIHYSCVEWCLSLSTLLCLCCTEFYTSSLTSEQLKLIYSLPISLWGFSSLPWSQSLYQYCLTHFHSIMS